MLTNIDLKIVAYKGLGKISSIPAFIPYILNSSATCPVIPTIVTAASFLNWLLSLMNFLMDYVALTPSITGMLISIKMISYRMPKFILYSKVSKASKPLIQKSTWLSTSTPKDWSIILIADWQNSSSSTTISRCYFHFIISLYFFSWSSIFDKTLYYLVTFASRSMAGILIIPMFYWVM